MNILMANDTTSLSYWLNWKVLICAIWVLTPMVIALYMIWKYEHSYNSESEKRGTQQDRAEGLYDDDAWRPCLKEIHPLWLLAFRIIAFIVLLGTIIADVTVNGGSILYYYTEWTLILVTIYFGLGSLLSVYGCHQHYKKHTTFHAHNGRTDTEQGLYVPFTEEGTEYRIRLEKELNNQDKGVYFPFVGILRWVFQVIFQMSAGAVMLTDCVYWFVIFPFLTVKDYETNTIALLTHSLNAVVLLGDTVLNCLPFPWSRISYFLLWTGIYVIFQWILHACVPLWWPYPFLDLSEQNAPVWYFLVAVLHIPCYGICSLILDFKHYLLSRWFPLSYQYSR